MRKGVFKSFVAAALMGTAADVASAQARWSVGAPLTVIRAESGGAETIFSSIRDVQRLPTGEILVADGASNELRFFNADGRFARRVGRTGSGPAEFRRIAGIVLERDSLRVFDPSLRKIVTLSVRGAFGRTQRIEPTGSARHSLSLYRLAGYIEGGPVFIASGFPGGRLPVATRYWDSVPTLRYSAVGLVRDTIGEFAGMDMYGAPELSGDVIFGRASSGAVSRNRLYMTDGGQMTVRVYGGSRTPVAMFTRAVAPRPVTERDRAAYDSQLRSRGRSDDGRRLIERSLAELPRATTKPWIAKLIVDEREHVWAEQYAQHWDAAARVWNVFDPRGAWVAEVTMPAGFRAHQIGADFVAGVLLDEDGVESVAVLELRRPASEP